MTIVVHKGSIFEFRRYGVHMVAKGLPWVGAALLLLGTTGTAWAATPPVSSNFSGTSAAGPIELVGASPQSYLTAYQNALNYLNAHVTSSGSVIDGSGASASATTTAYAAVALASNGALAPATAIVDHLRQAQTAGGGWNQALSASQPATLGATARVLWAMTQTAGMVGSSTASAWLPTVERGSQALVGFQSPVWGSFTSTSGSPAGSAETNAVAITALQQAVNWVGGGAATASWRAASNRAQAALLTDNGVRRQSTTDFLAAPLWNLDPNPVQAARTVGALFDLGFAYQGYGAKTGPGYYSGMDWTDGVSTFNDVVASVYANLPDAAEMQYNYGLTLQTASGGFGTSAHPPVGPETGSFTRGPSAPSVAVTAHYLLATDTLLGHGLIGFGWKSATYTAGGQTETVSAPPVASPDPAIAMQRGIRVAVVVSDPSTVISAAQPAMSSSNEANMELNAAWQLTQMGYNVSLVWYKPNHAESYYPQDYLWPNLKQFQVVVLSHNAFADQNGYKSSFAQHASALASWIQGGGRLIDLGDNGRVPLSNPLAVSLTPASINSVQWQGKTVDWTYAANAYYSSAAGYQTLASGQVGTTAEPVAVGTQNGQGRVVLTTLQVASHGQDHLPVTSALFNWATQGLQPSLPSIPSYTSAARSLYATIQSIYGVQGSGLYHELSSPTARQRKYSYLWPFSQAMAGINSSASALGQSTLTSALSQAQTGLSRYYDSAMTPPGYESYVASRGGGTPFFDDNGWTTLDLLRAYHDTNNQAFLTAAETDVKFLESGWNATLPPPGGEYFNVYRVGRTQTATGSFLDSVLRLYLATKNPSYLTWARTISTWDRTYMRGLNGIYNDGISPTGVVGGTPFTYDTGVVLQADVLRYRATGNTRYLHRAEQLATAAISAYVNPLNGVLVENAGSSNAPFNAILLRGLYMLWQVDHNPTWIQPLVRQADLALRYDRYANGIYGNNWAGLNNPAVPVDLLTQGGTLRLFGMLAHANIRGS